MSKTLFSIIIFVLLLGVFGNAFSASYIYSNIGNLAYVLALGIDVGEKSKLKISAQFSKTAVFTVSATLLVGVVICVAVVVFKKRASGKS